MPTIQEQVLGLFFEQLAKADEVDEGTLTELREVLSPERGKKVKADELVDVFNRKSERELR